jgi:hypothetical protein
MYYGAEHGSPVCLNAFFPAGMMNLVVHYWFYVRSAENLCKLREEMVERKIK